MGVKKKAPAGRPHASIDFTKPDWRFRLMRNRSYHEVVRRCGRAISLAGLWRWVSKDEWPSVDKIIAVCGAMGFRRIKIVTQSGFLVRATRLKRDQMGRVIVPDEPEDEEFLDEGPSEDSEDEIESEPESDAE